MIRLWLLALLVWSTSCGRYTYQVRTMPDASNLGALVPFVWAAHVRYEVVCDENNSLCKEGHLANGIGAALQALGHGWDVTNGPWVSDRDTLNLRVEIAIRKRGSEVKHGFRTALAIVTLGIIPYVAPSEIEIHVTAQRGAQTIFTRRRLGDGNLATVVSLNPLVIGAATSSADRVSRAIGADVVVASMNQLTRSQSQ